MNDNNIFTLHGGGKDKVDDETLPVNSYILEDLDGDQYEASGFLVFTSQHVAVMRDEGKGAIPILVMPLTRCKVAEIDDGSHELRNDLPF